MNLNLEFNNLENILRIFFNKYFKKLNILYKISIKEF